LNSHQQSDCARHQAFPDADDEIMRCIAQGSFNFKTGRRTTQTA